LSGGDAVPGARQTLPMAEKTAGDKLEVIRFGQGSEASLPELIELTPAFEAASFSEIETRLVATPERTEAWRQAGLWSLAVLKNLLGETWPGETWRVTKDRLAKPWLPGELCAAHYHTRHYARLVELALRLTELNPLPGMAGVRTALRTDRTPQRWEHTLLQLEMGALARTGGAEVTFEGARLANRSKPVWPADVEVAVEGRRVAIEAFAVLPSDAWLASVERSDQIQARIRSIEQRYQVACSISFGGETLGEPGALQRFVDEIEYGAAIVAAGATSHAAHEGTATALVGRDIDSGFSGPPILNENAWDRIAARLTAKQQQVGTSDVPVWLRVDLLEGLWQFTTWSRAPLARKLELIAPQFEGALGRGGNLVGGAVVSSGAAWGQGRFEAEDARALHGRRALRRLIAPIRVRETLVIPQRANATEDGEWLASIYDHEPAWLSKALEGAGLPPLDEMFPQNQPTPIITIGPAQRWRHLGQ
jgi:hypothetical protein